MAEHGLQGTQDFRISRNVYLFYDVFVTPSLESICCIGPSYPDDRVLRHGIDYDKIYCVIHQDGSKVVVKGQMIRSEQQEHKHNTLILLFQHDLRAIFENQDTVQITLHANQRLTRRCLLSKPVRQKHYFTIATLFKDQNHLLQEWIDYHLLMGADHFYLYDNGSRDQKTLVSILRPYIRAGFATLIRWDFQFWDQKLPHLLLHERHLAKPQQENHSIYKYGSCRWMALIDTDEYIYPVKDADVVSVIREHDQMSNTVGGLSLRCLWFGCSGFMTSPKVFQAEERAIFALTKRKALVESRDGRPKVIVNPANVRLFCQHVIVSGKETLHLDPELMRFNHYWVLSSKRPCIHEIYDAVDDDSICRFRQLFLRKPGVVPGFGQARAIRGIQQEESKRRIVQRVKRMLPEFMIDILRTGKRWLAKI